MIEIIFNRDTSDLNECQADLSYGMNPNNGTITVADDLKATCTKPPRMHFKRCREDA